MVNSYHQKTFIILKSNDVSKSNFTILQYKQNIGRGNHKYSTERFQENSSLDNCPPPRTIPTQDNCLPRQCPTGTISPWTIPPDNFHLGLLYCPQIITPGKLLPREITITNYNFFMAIFCFCFFLPNYIISGYCYDNKNNNDNSNKTWSLKFVERYDLATLTKG